MKLSLYSDYAMRVMIHLAAKDEKISIREVADIYDISQNHLMKVVQDLAGAGFIEAVRGRNGGLRLAKPADQINLGSILRHTEKLTDLFVCEGCIIAPACGLPVVLREATAAFVAVFDRYSLADVVKKKSDLAALLTAISHV
ncbi:MULTISPECIES: Rrf2 family transcriptional regulator [Agrobacterium]|uniref:Rrf2 family transcriptional regulator n=1 Tax=Agrobacterium pusense TaxID=648995 RepID=A0AA44EGG8_9HYPH|nr:MULTISPECIES: Rrf2 family transcriptional regulator [Agrobacterium]KNY30632.1 Rrf2 family transcriptional regulator [Agrobacterium sp. SUL3]NRF07175.1 Rrf2 family transcriptional regulator [Agrobacterium pusense]NRF17728.1 Rrf2 family transcriptional regulator [Agrobacterium pusense]TQN55958.1 Rrf2 family transcriptional regulator [Agrobacterium tumefaciens]